MEVFNKVSLNRETNVYTEDSILDATDVLLRLESTNRCNFKCTFCPHPEMIRDKGFMEVDLFHKIIDQASELGITKLDLRNFGEPILDKRLPALAEYAKNKGFDKIYIHTNGYGISEKLLSSWGVSGIKDVNISLSPKREFEESRPGISADKLFSQIEKVMLSDCEWKNILSVDYIKTGLSNEEEEVEFLNWIEKYGINKRIDIDLHNWAKGKSNKFMQCHRLWTSITVLWDGRVSLCCLDYEGDVILGDLNNESLSDVINNEKYRLIRENHINGLFLEKCASCNMVEVKDNIKPSYSKIDKI